MAHTFEMLVKSDQTASIFDDKLVSSVDGNTKQGWLFTWYVRLASPIELSAANVREIRESRVIMTKEREDGMTIQQSIHKVNEYGFYLSTKLSYPNSDAVELINVPLTEASYNHLSLLAETNYPYTRIKLPPHDNSLYYEVDEFITPAGDKHPWVKVSLFTSDLSLEVPKMPFTCHEYIIDIEGQLKDNDRLFIKRLWQDQYFHKDPEWIGTKVKVDYDIKSLD